MSKTFQPSRLCQVAFLVVRLLLTPGLTALANEPEQIWIDETPGQTLTGWGLAVNLFEAPREVRNTLVAEANATCFKLILEGGGHNEAAAVDTLRPEVVGRLLFVLDLFKHHGGKIYFTSGDSPPPTMKRYYSKRGNVDLNPNSLRGEEREHYAEFVVAMLKAIQAKGHPLPLAHSIQDDASRLYGFVACPYDPEQYAETVACFRRTFVERELPVPVIGPEVTGYLATLRYDSEISGSAPDLLCYKGQGNAETEFGSFSEQSLPRPSKEVWMTGWACYQALNEDAAVVQAMHRLAADMTLARATLWTWEAGYTPERSSYAMLHGAGTKTKLFTALSLLWKTAAPGSCVLRAGIGPRSASGIATVDALAFGGQERDTLVLINAKSESRIVRLPEQVMSGGHAWNSRSELTQDISPADCIIIPAESVSILTWPKKNLPPGH